MTTATKIQVEIIKQLENEVFQRNMKYAKTESITYLKPSPIVTYMLFSNECFLDTTVFKEDNNIATEFEELQSTPSLIELMPTELVISNKAYGIKIRVLIGKDINGNPIKVGIQEDFYKPLKSATALFFTKGIGEPILYRKSSQLYYSAIFEPICIK